MKRKVIYELYTVNSFYTIIIEDNEDSIPAVKNSVSRSELCCIIFTIIIVLVSIFLGFMVIYCHDGGRNQCPLLHDVLNVTGIMTYIM